MYYVRHGESEANLLGVWAGSQSDSPLTELGVKQAIETGEKLKGKRISRIISSPLIRAHHTAQKIAEVIGFNSDLIELEPRIVEYDLGVLSGKPKNNLSSVTLRTELTAEVPEIFQTRIYHFLKEISEQKHDDLLVVAHSGVQRMIEIIKEKK